MDSNENRAWLAADNAKQEARIERNALKKERGTKLSSTDAPKAYWAQGKAFFITNPAHDRFFVIGQGDVGPNREDGDYITDEQWMASLRPDLSYMQALIDTNSVLERTDFERGPDGLAFYRFWQEAQIGVLVFKARDQRFRTHLDKKAD